MPQQRTDPAVQCTDPALCVDLDGTLVKSDLLIESFFALLRQNLLAVFLVPIWLCKGKAFMKARIAERVELDVSALPYHFEFLGYLQEERARGRRLVLATSATRKLADQVAQHLKLFDAVHCTDHTVNLDGERKLARLREECGDQGFDYAGNARVDLKIWPHARFAVLVNPDQGIKAQVAQLAEVGRIFEDRASQWRVYLRALRLHQWLKNTLLFVPLLAAHQIDNPALLVQVSVGFLAFGLCASSVYLLNDLLDLTADRHHPRKRHRPFAAGSINILHGALLIPALLLMALALALTLPWEFLAALATYYVATLAYSLRLKNVVMVDVLVLAGLYTLRIIAGAAAVQVALSFWLLAFSMFIFLSLAFIKRYSELLSLQTESRKTRQARGYRVDDLPLLSSQGAASGYLAVLVLALYINGPTVQSMYRHAELIWLLCPLLLYWISRIWLKTHRGQMHDDPVVFAITDWVSALVVGLSAAILWAAT